MKVIMENWKKFINEEDEHEDEDPSFKLGYLLSEKADSIIQGIHMAGMMGLTPEEVPFEKMDLSQKNVPDYWDLLKIAETVLEYYEDRIASDSRRLLKRSMEQGLRRRLKLGQKTGMEDGASKIREIIKNGLMAHTRKINVIAAKK